MTPRKIRNIHLALFASCLMLFGAIAGCNEKPNDRLAVFPASGKALYRGGPAIGAKVFLHPLDGSGAKKGLVPYGVTKEDGTYQVTTYVMDDGAPAGRYAITIYWPAQQSPPRTLAEWEAQVGGGRKPDRLRGRYSDPKRSPWTVSITPGQNKLPVLRFK